MTSIIVRNVLPHTSHPSLAVCKAFSMNASRLFEICYKAECSLMHAHTNIVPFGLTNICLLLYSISLPPVSVSHVCKQLFYAHITSPCNSYTMPLAMPTHPASYLTCMHDSCSEAPIITESTLVVEDGVIKCYYYSYFSKYVCHYSVALIIRRKVS